MPLSMYKIKLRVFEKKYHNLLVDMFSTIKHCWATYNTKYNDKIDINYTSFVKYCYSITNNRPRMY
jgi:hypothetical protein